MSIFVGNLPFRAEREDVVELFAPFGEVSNCSLPLERATGRKRGERVFCISDNKDFPCKNYLATILPSVSSFDAMTQIFEVKFDRTKIMNETVERLYITPSELIE